MHKAVAQQRALSHSKKRKRFDVKKAAAKAGPAKYQAESRTKPDQFVRNIHFQ